MATIKTICGDELRRFHVPEAELQKDQAWSFVLEAICLNYGKDIQVHYRDDEDDMCLLTSEDELQEALRLNKHLTSSQKPLHLFITVGKGGPMGDGKCNAQELSHPPETGPFDSQPPLLRLLEQSVNPASASFTPAMREPEEDDGVLVVVPDSPSASSESVGLPLQVSDGKEKEETQAASNQADIAPATAEVEAAAAEPDSSRAEVEAAAEPDSSRAEVEAAAAEADSSRAEVEAEPEAENQEETEGKAHEEAKNVPVARAVHEGVGCAICEMSPIIGYRYKCTVCTDFDLCESCHNHGLHFPTHALVQAKVPLQATEMDELCGRPAAPKADFVDDVTIPDGTPLPPDVLITKTWSLKNTGKGMWPRSTRLVFISGNLPPCGTQDIPTVPIANPGDVVEVSAILKMPSKPGRYTGYYRLAYGPENSKFGHRVWVDVVVSPASASLAPASEEPAPAPMEEQKSVMGMMQEAFMSSFNRVAAKVQGQGERTDEEGHHIEHASVLLGNKMLKCPGCYKAACPPPDTPRGKLFFACETCATIIHMQEDADPAPAPAPAHAQPVMQEEQKQAQQAAVAQDFEQELQLALKLSKEEATKAAALEEGKSSAQAAQGPEATAEAKAQVAVEVEPAPYAVEIQKLREFGFTEPDDAALVDLLQAAKGDLETVMNWLLASSK